MHGNANGSNRLKRLELEFKGNSYLFTINPERYEMTIPNRLNLTYTKNGAFIDLFGEGIIEINIEGTTGFKAGTKNPDHGYEKFIELRKLIRDVFQDITDGAKVEEFLMFYNHTDGDGWVTVPSKLNIFRNVQQPLLYKYDLSLYAIREAGQPAPEEDVQELGNALGTPTTSSETVNDTTEAEGDGDSDAFTSSNVSEGEKGINEESKSDLEYIQVEIDGWIKEIEPGGAR